MYKIKKICYDADSRVVPYEEFSYSDFSDQNAAEMFAIRLAEEECRELNKGSACCFFHPNDDGDEHLVVVECYDKSPLDRMETSAIIRSVTEYDVVEVTKELVDKIAQRYTKKLRKKHEENDTMQILGTICDDENKTPVYWWKNKHQESTVTYRSPAQAMQLADEYLTNIDLYVG